jgi:hypothetical protein
MITNKEEGRKIKNTSKTGSRKQEKYILLFLVVITFGNSISCIYKNTTIVLKDDQQIVNEYTKKQKPLISMSKLKCVNCCIVLHLLFVDHLLKL